MNVGDMTVRETEECVDILENLKNKPETLERNKKRVYYKIRMWKMRPGHGYGVYPVQSFMCPLEPELSFFHDIMKQMISDGYAVGFCETSNIGSYFAISTSHDELFKMNPSLKDVAKWDFS